MRDLPPLLPASRRHPRARLFLLHALAAFAASLTLIAACHRLGLVSPIREPSYPYSQAITRCLSPGFLLGYIATAFLLGRFLRNPQAVAAGMLAPLPCAVAIELIQDRTSHNLLPFEIVLYWAPAFLLALLSAWAGNKSFRKTS